MSNKLKTSVTENVKVVNGRGVGKFTAADRKNSREALSALVQLELVRQEVEKAKAEGADITPEGLKNRNVSLTINKEVTTMTVDGESKDLDTDEFVNND